MYMSFAVTSQHGVINGQFWKLLPLVLLFAATNAWSEEIVSRFVIVAGLHGKLSPSVICWISSLIFGVPHFFGTPSGPFGALMAGLMGWLLARSMLETKSLGWALFIHFLQDLVIFGGGAVIIAGTPS
jgi:membrane protease YdiL (CAAX protease family)